MGGGAEIAPEQRETAVLVPNSRLPLFADISPFKLSQSSPMTKSGDGMIPLESLLNREKSASDPFENLTFTEVPFHDDGVLVKLSSKRDGSDARFASVKKFLITRTSQTKSAEYVVTMLPDAFYAESHPDFTFITRPDFTGIIIYSKLDGQVFEVRKYICGKICPAKFLSEEEINENPEEKTFIFFPSSLDIKTKGNEDEDNLLDPSYCTAERKKDDDEWWNTNRRDPDPNYDTRPGGGGYGDGSSKKGSGQKGDDSEQDIDDKDKLEEEYSVSISCNAPEAVTLIGDGTYQKEQTVHISYNYKVPYDIRFKHWAGDFSDRSSANFSFIIERNMQSLAFFEWGNIPCMRQDHTTNPLINMSVAPSGFNWDNWNGGTFGWTRSDYNKAGELVPKYHSGLDLAAPEGTPVYSMYDGVVERTFITARRDKLGENDNGGYGNEIRIKATLSSGESISIQYAHLQYDNPIAFNSIMGRAFKVGDRVFAGEIIAFSGRSGNAWNVRHFHVHLGIRENNAWVDPKQYINGTYIEKNLSANNGKITVTDCL